MLLDPLDKQNAYKIGRIQGILRSYNRSVVRSSDALSQIDDIVNPVECERVKKEWEV